MTTTNGMKSNRRVDTPRDLDEARQLRSLSETLQAAGEGVTIPETTLDTTLEEYSTRQPPGTDASVAEAFRKISATGERLAKFYEELGAAAINHAESVCQHYEDVKTTVKANAHAFNEKCGQRAEQERVEATNEAHRASRVITAQLKRAKALDGVSGAGKEDD